MEWAAAAALKEALAWVAYGGDELPPDQPEDPYSTLARQAGIKPGPQR